MEERRNSILRTDEKAKKKKRISFKETKSVRTFSSGDETKKYDESYEEKYHVSSENSTGSKTTFGLVLSLKTDLSAQESINKSLSELSRIEHSVDITLLESEQRIKNKGKLQAEAGNLESEKEIIPIMKDARGIPDEIEDFSVSNMEIDNQDEVIHSQTRNFQQSYISVSKVGAIPRQNHTQYQGKMDIEKGASEMQATFEKGVLIEEDMVCEEPMRNFDENIEDMMEVATSTGGISGISREKRKTILFDSGEPIVCESPVCNKLQTALKDPSMQCHNKEDSLQVKNKTNVLPVAFDVAEKENLTMELTPLSERHHVRTTLNFDDEATATENVIPFVPSFNANTGANSLVFDKSQSFRRDKYDIRFSEADEKLLDNTSYLARAKLGDETASRNNSKYSNPGKNAKTTEMDSLKNIETCFQFGDSAAHEEIRLLNTQYLRPNKNAVENPDDDMDIETPTGKNNCSLKFLDELQTGFEAHFEAKKTESGELAHGIEAVNALNSHILSPMKIESNNNTPHDTFGILDDSSEDTWVRSGLQSLRKTMMVEDGEAMDCVQTPIKKGIFCNNLQMTPHRSILEFEAIEEEIRVDEESSTSIKPLIKSKNRETIHVPKNMTLDCSGLAILDNDDADSFKSPVTNASTKRSWQDHLTPNWPDCKKQSTVTTEKTVQQNEAESFVNISKESPLRDFDENTLQKSLDCFATNSSRFDVGAGNPNNRYEDQITLNSKQREQKSIQSSLKNDIFIDESVLSTSPNFNDLSVPTTRKAVLSATSIKERSNHHESVFKEDVITISDVTMHFEQQNRRTSSNTPEPKNKRRLSKRDSLQNLIRNIESDSMDNSYLQRIEKILDENSDDDDQHIDCSESANREINEQNQNMEDNELGGVDDVVASTSKAARELSTETIKGKNKDQNQNMEEDEIGAVGGVVASTSKAAKCASCNHTINKHMIEAKNRESDSFVIPPIPSVTLDYSGLMRARKGPNLKTAGEIWEAMSMEPALLRDMDRAINGENVEIDDEEFIKNDPLIQEVKKRSKVVNDRIEAIRQDRKRERFIVRLQRRITDEGFSKDWLYIMKLECMQILRIRHIDVLTLWIHINFEIKGPNGKDAIITNIKFTESEYEKKNWSAIDYVVYYQLKSEVFLDGFDLQLTEDPEEIVMQSIRYAHPITTSVLNLFNEMSFILFSNYCRLELEGTRVFITKVSRKVVPPDEKIQYRRVEKKLFAVQLKNMRTVSYCDITTPPISAFKETIKTLPTGLEFIKSFFEDPDIYLKN